MTTANASAPEAKTLNPLETHHFLLRRLHSLTGVLPIGVFVIFHLFTNAQMIWGALGFEDAFQHEVEFIHSLPALLFLEIFGLWLPIGFHAALGFYYTFSGKSNVGSYRYGGNVRYTLQRVTGILAFVFIFFHIATLRWRWDVFGWYTPFYLEADFAGQRVDLASTSVMVAFHGGPDGSILFAVAMVLFYTVGAMSAVFHWSNGLWTSAITWGITTTPQSFRRWGYVCAAMFVALASFMAIAIYGSVIFEPTELQMAAWLDAAGLDAEGVAAFDGLTSDAATVLGGAGESGFSSPPGPPTVD